ncbi:CHY zinc finger protein [Endozoicomonas sp. ISHI1]|uniref:CHY zinc finger protein n=3 Tax=Endozoicomonas TaxID=305899 RepID=UPI0021498E11
MSLLLPEGFDDQYCVLCFKTPVVSADSDIIALLVKNDLSNYPPPPPWKGGGGWPSGLFEIDLVILTPVISWLMSKGRDSTSFEEQPSLARLKMTRVNADGYSSEAVIPVGWRDFLNIEQMTDVYFWNTLFQRTAIACPASENHQCLKLFLERTALKTHHAVSFKEGSADGEPYGKVADQESKDENNDHQKEQRDEPEGQESRSPAEWNDGSGNNRKDDNGEENEKNATTQDLQRLANQLIAIIESGDPDAVLKLREILYELDMPQRLQVLETKGRNSGGNPVTPLEAILELQRSFKEHSLRNRFIEQLIEATSDKTRNLNDPDILSSLQPIIPPDRTLPEAGDNNLRILYKIVQDIIHRVNQSGQQPPIGAFEKCCFAEYFVQLFLLYSNPLESIRELLVKLSDSAIIGDILIHAQSLTFSISFRDTFIQLKQHPSLRELVRLSNELTRQAHTFHSLQKPSRQVPLIAPEISHSDNTSNDTTASNRNRFTDSIQQVNSSHSASGGCSPDLPMDRYLQQGARPKRRALANQQNASSQKQLKERPLYGDHQANKAHNRSDFEVLEINQNVSSKHSTDDSLPIEFKRHAQDKEEKKRQQIEELAEEIEGLRIKNRALTMEAQGLRMQNRDLANMNQNLMAESRRHRDLMSNSETTNQCLREQIKKLYVDLESKQGVIDYLIHQAAENTAQRLTAANNPAMPGNDTARFDSHQPLSPPNEQSLSSIDHTEPPSVNNIPREEHPPIAETNPTMSGSDEEYRASQQLTSPNEQSLSSIDRTEPPSVNNIPRGEHPPIPETSPMSGSDESNIDNEEAYPRQEQVTTCWDKNRNRSCSHYHRSCRLNFGCCARYFPCQICHNASDDCDVKDRKAIDAKKLQCCFCNYEGDITEDSQTCPGCNQKMSEYFCAKCKHFTCKERKPHHCDKCGICRVNKHKSFHCDVCNICLDKRLEGNHKCRENSGHDLCCICLEDAFSGCQILPCSHKVHRNCVIAMIQHGIRTCPMCRHPLYTPVNGNNH